MQSETKTKLKQKQTKTKHHIQYSTDSNLIDITNLSYCLIQNKQWQMFMFTNIVFIRVPKVHSEEIKWVTHKGLCFVRLLLLLIGSLPSFSPD